MARRSQQLSLLQYIADRPSPPRPSPVNLDQVIQDIRALSDAEREVLRLIASQGRTRVELAAQLGVHEHSAKKYVDGLVSRELIVPLSGKRRDIVWGLHPHFLDRATVLGAHTPPTQRWSP